MPGPDDDFDFFGTNDSGGFDSDGDQFRFDFEALRDDATTQGQDFSQPKITTTGDLVRSNFKDLLGNIGLGGLFGSRNRPTRKASGESEDGQGGSHSDKKSAQRGDDAGRFVDAAVPAVAKVGGKVAGAVIEGTGNFASMVWRTAFKRRQKEPFGDYTKRVFRNTGAVALLTVLAWVGCRSDGCTTLGSPLHDERSSQPDKSPDHSNDSSWLDSATKNFGDFADKVGNEAARITKEVEPYFDSPEQKKY